jgi:hypothetical protein
MSVELHCPPKPEENQKNSKFFNGKNHTFHSGFEPGTSELAIGSLNHCTIGSVRPNLMPSFSRAVLLHKLRAASRSCIVIPPANHSNLPEDWSRISKNFEKNWDIQPLQLVTPIDEDFVVWNLLAIPQTSDNLVWKFKAEQKRRQDSVFLRWNNRYILQIFFIFFTNLHISSVCFKNLQILGIFKKPWDSLLLS